MHKKLGLYLSLFIIVLIVNVYIAFALFAKAKRVEANTRILSEIENDMDGTALDHNPAPFAPGEGLESKVVTGDARSKSLKHFFRKYNSDLYDLSDYIVKVSDKYQFDYRLLPAIAMQESNLCRFIPPDSHNCWGWGIYGTTVTRFDTYEEAIDAVAKGVRENYIDHGLVTASAIMQKYTPSSNGSWARGVNNVLGWLE